jgi:hypothetical protein
MYFKENTLYFIKKTSRQMLLRNIIAVYSEKYIKHINTLWENYTDIVTLREMVNIVTT